MMRHACLVGVVVGMLMVASCSKRSEAPKVADKKADTASTPAAVVQQPVVTEKKPEAASPAVAVAAEEKTVATELAAWLNEQHAKLPVGEIASVSLKVKDADTIIFATANVSRGDLATEWPTLGQEAINAIVTKMQGEEGAMVFLLKGDAICQVAKLKSEAALEGSYCKGWAVENGEAAVSVMKNKLPYAPFVALQFQ